MFAENLTPFFDVGDFGDEFEFDRDGTPVGTINCIFDSPSQEMAFYDRSFYDEKFYSAKVAANSPRLLTKTSSAAPLRRNDSTVYGGSTYYVTFLESDGTGLSLIHLSLDRS